MYWCRHKRNNFNYIQKKEIIRKYFYNDKFYKDVIKKKNDLRVVKEYKKILSYRKRIRFVYQNKPKGTGDAVLKTKRYIKDKYFLMLLLAYKKIN